MTYLNSVLEYFDLAKNYRNYQMALIKNFLKKKILEVGPGRGEMASNFTNDGNKEIVLSETDGEMCEILKKRFSNNNNVKIINSEIKNIHDKFGTILYLDVIEHIEKHEEEILLAYSKLEKDGYLVFIVPAFQHLFSKFDSSVGHYRRYQSKFFKDFSKKNNIECVKLIYFDSIGYFILALSKFLNLKQNKSVNLGIKFWNFLIPISRFIDKLLLHLIGKSLLCVYRKK